jgi:hypothetical protein
MVEFARHGIQTGLDISQALAIGKLSETHAEELIPAGKVPNPVITLIAFDAFTELIHG